MKIIAVKALPGRVAFTAPRGGERIPHDVFKTVEHTAWIEALLTKHGDIVRKEDDVAAPTKADKTAKGA